MPPTRTDAPQRRMYTDRDKRVAYEHWVSIGKNTRRTAKDLHIPEPTFQSWARGWIKTGEVPPELTPEDVAELTIGDDAPILPDLKAIRRAALKRMREIVDKTNNLDQLGRVVEQFSNRIDRAEGQGEPPPSVGSGNASLQLPEPGVDGLLLSIVRPTLAAQSERAEEITDVEGSLELPAPEKSQ